MNYLQMVLGFLSLAEVIVKPFLKSPEAVNVFNSASGILNNVANGLANQNPDGTPATQAYIPTPATPVGPTHAATSAIRPTAL